MFLTKQLQALLQNRFAMTSDEYASLPQFFKSRLFNELRVLTGVMEMRGNIEDLVNTNDQYEASPLVLSDSGFPASENRWLSPLIESFYGDLQSNMNEVRNYHDKLLLMYREQTTRQETAIAEMLQLIKSIDDSPDKVLEIIHTYERFSIMLELLTAMSTVEPQNGHRFGSLYPDGPKATRDAWRIINECFNKVGPMTYVDVLDEHVKLSVNLKAGTFLSRTSEHERKLMLEYITGVMDKNPPAESMGVQ